MEQAIMTSTPQPKNADREHRRRWLHYFFSEDLWQDNYRVLELQRRAIWISVAIILQGFHEPAFNLLRALSESSDRTYKPLLLALASLLPMILILGSFFALWMSFRPDRPEKKKRDGAASTLTRQPALWKRMILVFMLLGALIGAIGFGQTLIVSFLPPSFANDGTALDANAAALLLQGRNPYTDSSLKNLAQLYPIQPYWSTPLRVGRFANRLDYPSLPELQSALKSDLKTGSTTEFESKVSYPALSFLPLVPFVWLSDYNVLLFYLLCHLLLIAVAWKFA